MCRRVLQSVPLKSYHAGGLRRAIRWGCCSRLKVDMSKNVAHSLILLIPAMLHGATGTTTSLSSSVNPVVFGSPVTLTATVSPNPGSGSVTFYAGTTILETEPLSNGKAALTTTLLPFGALSLKARYNGNSTFSASSSTALSQTVNTVLGEGFQAAGSFAQSAVAVGDLNSDGKQDLALGTSTGVEVMLGNGDGTFQTPASYTTAGSGGATSITVGDFNGDGKPDLAVSFDKVIYVLLGNGDGAFQAAVQIASGYEETNTLTVGDFNGDGKADLAFGGYSSVGGSSGSVFVMLGNGDGTFAQPWTFTLTGGYLPYLALGDFNGDGIPDLAYSAQFQTGILLGNGDGTFRAGGSYSNLSGGLDVATADLNGDGKLDVVVAVGDDNTLLWVFLGNGDGTLQPPVKYEVPGLTNWVAIADFNGDGKPDLATNYTEALNSFSVLLGNGDGTFRTSANYFSQGSVYGPLVVGDFNGDGRADVAYPGSVLLALGPPTTTALESSLNPSTFAQSVTLTATVSPSTATGNVTFYDGSTSLGVDALTSGVASLSLTTLSVGSHPLTAVYGGDSNEGTSTSAILTQTVNARTTSTTLASSPNPSTYGQSVLLTATVSPAIATGTVTFYNQSTVLGTGVVSDGTATLSISTLPVGTYFLTAAYGGDPGDGTSNSVVLTQTVNAIVTSTALTSSPNPSVYSQTVALTASVSPATATGVVTFYHGATSLGTGTLSGGQATLSLSTFTAGGHSLTATYGGDPSDRPSTSPVITQVVNPATTSTILTSSPNPSTFRKNVTLTATVSPSIATGTVTFYRGGTSIGTGVLNGGIASLITASLPEGTNTLKAVYGGDANDTTSTSNVISQEVRAITSTALTSTPNPSAVGETVTLTATVTPSVATGTVTFYHGATPMGTGTLSGGKATITSSGIPEGNHALTATYNGDTNDAPSTSPIVNQVVN